MIKVVIEVENGAAQFDVTVQAENIKRAGSLVAARHCAGDVRVKFPIDPEGFFVKVPSAPGDLSGHEPPEKAAA